MAEYLGLLSARGVGNSTIATHVRNAHRFFGWFKGRMAWSGLKALTLEAVDEYLDSRARHLQREGRITVVSTTRRLLAHLHAHGHIRRDLAAHVPWPRRYAFDRIPQVLADRDVAKVLQTLAGDTSATGRRDYAMLCLLATYGLRRGEVVHLRLGDVDWRNDRLNIAQTKTGNFNVLPLVEPAGTALLRYVRHARPRTAGRQVFVRCIAPYDRPLTAAALSAIVVHRLAEAGIRPPVGKCVHAFRYTRALSLLQHGVPLKVIGDVLGHRSAEATHVYLKLPSDALRDVALDIPRRR